MHRDETATLRRYLIISLNVVVMHIHEAADIDLPVFDQQREALRQCGLADSKMRQEKVVVRMFRQ